MLSAVGLWISRVFRRVMPDPFVIAILLTALVFVVGMAAGDFPGLAGGDRGGAARATALLEAWRGEKGIWAFLAFSMQMCLILVTGYALASTVLVRAGIDALAGRPRGTGQAAALVGFCACATGVINWGLGLIVGALLAREVGRSLAARGVRAHYPLIVGAGYTGLMVWHGGLSGSAPLSMTTVEGAAKVLRPEYLAQIGGGVPLSRTLFSASNLVITGGLLVITPAVLALLSPRRAEDCVPFDAARLPAPVRGHEPVPTVVATDPSAERGSIPDRLERTALVAWLLGVPLLVGVIYHAAVRGFSTIGINEVNMAVLGVGLLLHGSVRSYSAAVEDAMRGCAGILLQFPLYGGIMGMMAASGLVGIVARWISGVSTPATLPLNTYLSAAVLNLFVPSGGGQWAVQGPIALESAVKMGVDPARVVMAVAYGDQLTNMLQPFWALPLLAITGARARDIVGYTAVVMLAAGVWIGVGLVAL
jgi:short-chain fatty acids transporter